jgi:UDP-3-O-[3-hydroxymyristoyl] glucosamine N-acyltransferase
VEVGDNIIIGTMAVATKKMDEPGHYAGLPAIPAAEWRRQQVLIRKLPEMEKRLKELEKMLADQKGS